MAEEQKLPQYRVMTFEVTVAGAMREEHQDEIINALKQCDLDHLPCAIAEVSWLQSEGAPIGTPGWEPGEEGINRIR